MSSPAVQLSFTLRTSPNVRTVHLLGSWDTYKSQLPLSLVKDAKSGTWRGTFRFQGSNALRLGSRYWYYYIVDGYHVSHDPSKEFTVEKTTGRKLNILDVPGGKTTTTSSRARPTVNTSGANNRHSREVPVGRSLSPSKIAHPKPTKAYASRNIREADYETSPIDDDLADHFASVAISSDRHHPSYDRHAAPYSSSPSDLSDSSGGGNCFSSSGGSSPSSMSSVSTGSCKCERFGITRSGQRVRLDCGGAKCGYNSSDCSSSDDSQDSESEEEYRTRVRKTELMREKERQLQKARSGVQVDRHGVPIKSSATSRQSGGDSRRR